MKRKIDKAHEGKRPRISVDSSLNNYQGKILYPKKLEIAEENLKGARVPLKKKQSK